MRDIIRFFKSNEKMDIMSTARYYFLQYILYKRRLKKINPGSLIISPIRLLGAQYIEIGGGVTIMKNARIEALDRYNEETYNPNLIIGDNTCIGQNFHVVVVDNVYIGRDVTISGNVYISDVLHNYDLIGLHILKQKLNVKHTYIGDNCFIGYGAAILPGVVLGRQCIVGANAVVVAGKYPDYSVLVGNPARIIKRYDVESGKWDRNCL